MIRNLFNKWNKMSIEEREDIVVPLMLVIGLTIYGLINIF